MMQGASDGKRRSIARWPESCTAPPIVLGARPDVVQPNAAGETADARRLLPSRLGPEDVHIWYLEWNERVLPAEITACRELMSPEELARAGRFLFEKDRDRYCMSHALVRSVLSEYASVDPRHWRFAHNRYGRPRIAEPAGVLPLRFNLSHTTHLLACAVTLDREIGVDVEAVRDGFGGVDIARRYFSSSEVAALDQLPKADQARGFFEYWTLKEAYLKARGMGLALPLDAFSIHLRGDEPTISFTAAIDDDPRSWQLSLSRPSGRHVMAVAVRRPPGHDLALTACRIAASGSHAIDPLLSGTVRPEVDRPARSMGPILVR